MPDNAYRQDLMSVYTEIPRRVLITMSIITMRSFFPQTLRAIVYALQNLDRNFANLVAPPTDESAKCSVRCKVGLWFRNRCRKQRPSRCIIGEWRRYPSSNWYEIDQKRGCKFGALLWRHLTPQRKTET